MKKIFVKVCPFCKSEKIISPIPQTSALYECKSCGAKQFIPVEVEKK